MIDLSRCRLPPYKHQIEGVERLVKQSYFALWCEMGSGKTKQVIDAAQVLTTMGIIDHVVVICPAAVRSVWMDPELGEISKHAWVNMPIKVTEYHAQTRSWEWFTKIDGKKVEPKLFFTISNFDFVRSKDRLKELLKKCDRKTLLVLDESSAVKNWKSKQTKSCKEIRSYCGRVVLLNGTPIANSPADLYSQADIMDPKILDCKSFFHFRARFAILGGWQGKVIVNWRDLDILQSKLAPYVLRRLKSQCLDLPPKIDSVVMSVPLSPIVWKIYKEMRDEMVAQLSDSTITSAAQAVVKAIRLAQITSGFVGGVELHELTPGAEPRPDWIEEDGPPLEAPKPTNLFDIPLQEVGREKLDFFLSWLSDQLEIDPNLKLLTWCRFRPEVARLFAELDNRYNASGLTLKTNLHLGKIWGGQKRAERDETLRLLDPRTAPTGPVVVIGTPASGSMGLNLTAAHTVIYLSNDFSLKTRLQSEDRVHRPGQVHSVSYFDIIATGPQGQKTIDHSVVKSLKNKQVMADFVTSDWLDVLSED